MEIKVNSRYTGGRGLYRITYMSGYIYCGSFVNSYGSHKRIVAETYFGSSSVAKAYKWCIGCVSHKDSEYNKSQIKLFEIWYIPESKRELQSLLEKKLINHACRHYGIADCALLLDNGKNEAFTSQYRHHGLCINLQVQDFRTAYKKAHELLRNGIVSEKQKEHYAEMHMLATRARTAETFKKASQTKRERGRKCSVLSTDGTLLYGTAKMISEQLGFSVEGTFHDAFKSGKSEYTTNRGRLKGWIFKPEH